jgi:hypothetical protein
MSTIIFFATFVIDKNGLAMIDNNTVLITMIVLVGICLLILICGFFLHLRYQSLTQISLLSYIPA